MVGAIPRRSVAALGAHRTREACSPRTACGRGCRPDWAPASPPCPFSCRCCREAGLRGGQRVPRAWPAARCAPVQTPKHTRQPRSYHSSRAAGYLLLEAGEAVLLPLEGSAESAAWDALPHSWHRSSSSSPGRPGRGCRREALLSCGTRAGLESGQLARRRHGEAEGRTNRGRSGTFLWAARQGVARAQFPERLGVEHQARWRCLGPRRVGSLSVPWHAVMSAREIVEDASSEANVGVVNIYRTTEDR
jgi:hypothetical protein